ncbi:hypothetical protein TNCT_457071 [Trichonephila clavata]|uniref:Uncharacterized protein n=1 Tax=Trichonephila clavata TaxID=2740835 RepID=A0A8X6KXD3_TRICU|nr:hypothetical protein TNCT_457071 [Trichonephila clavata]
MQTWSPSAKILYNQRFMEQTIPELNCPRNLSSTVARLRKGNFKGMEISPDNSGCYPISRNYPQTQLTPNHIFDCKAVLASLFKLDASPQDTLKLQTLPRLLLWLLDLYRSAAINL